MQDELVMKTQEGSTTIQPSANQFYRDLENSGLDSLLPKEEDCVARATD